MNEQILAQMEQIVNEVMTHFQTDFWKFDYPEIQKATPDRFPFIWAVRQNGTNLLRIGQYHEIFFLSEQVRYDYVRCGDPFSDELQYLSDEHLYLITEKEVNAITKAQAKSAIKDCVNPAVVRWKEMFGPLPKSLKITIAFSSRTSFSELKGVLRNDESGTLLKAFNRLRSWARRSKDHCIHVSYSPKERVFNFCEYINGDFGINGAIVYHGSSKEGYQMNGSYQITSDYGWHIHT